MDFSLSIGIDKYLNLSKTPYAENDAKGFHDVITQIYKVDFPILLLRDKATFTSILANLKNIASRIEDGDKFFFFFAGHGENIKSVPHICCYDTYPSDYNTWISIIKTIETISASGCNRNIIFIDACESTVKLGTRKNISKFSLDELEKNANDNTYSSVFSSSSHKGVADINPVTKHGIWSGYLLKALSGEDEKALNENLWLTNNTLQNYLSISVKKYCKGNPSVSVQSSFTWGKEEGEYIIRKFQRKEVKKYKIIPEKVLDKIEFSSKNYKEIKRLSGFVKGSHSVPKFYNSNTASFVNRISEEEIKKHIEKTSQRLRNLLKLKARDFKLTFNDGVATFECPYFIYSYSVQLNEDELSEAIFTAELYPIDIDKLIEYSNNFDKCFPKWFDYLIYTLNKNINVEELIERIEDADENILADYTFKYDSAKTYISIYNNSLDREIIISERKIEIKFQVKETIPSMIEGLKDLSNQIFLISNDYKLLG